MKNNVFTILKYTLIDGLKLNKSKTKEKIEGDTIKKRIKVYAYVAILIVFYVIMYFGIFYDGYKPNGLETYVLPMFMIITSFLVFIYSIKLTEAVLFKSRDYEMLTALPIKSSEILTTKILYLLGINYYISILIMLPASILYMKKEALPISFVLGNLGNALLIPFIPIVAGAILAIGIGMLSTKFKHTKAITTVATIALFVACMALPALFSGDALNNVTAAQLDQYIKIYYPVYMFKEMIANFNIISVLEYVALNIGIFILFLLLVSKTYGNVNQKLKEQFRIGKYKEYKFKTNSPRYSMTKKEIKKIFGTSMYFINTCFGGILLLLASLYIMFTPIEQINEIAAEAGMTISPAIIIALVAFISGFACTTGSSISLEGRQLWIYKTTPANTKDIFDSKILANVIVVVPFIILSVILLATKLYMDRISFILAILLPIVLVTFTAIVGLMINLKWPWLDFEAEIYVIKRSTASMLSIFIPMAVILFSVSAVLSFENYQLAFIVYTGVMALISYLLYRILQKWGKKKMDRLGDK